MALRRSPKVIIPTSRLPLTTGRRRICCSRISALSLGSGVMGETAITGLLIRSRIAIVRMIAPWVELRFDNQRVDHTKHAVLVLGVRQDVAVEGPDARIITGDDH